MIFINHTQKLQSLATRIHCSNCKQPPKNSVPRKVDNSKSEPKREKYAIGNQFTYLGMKKSLGVFQSTFCQWGYHQQPRYGTELLQPCPCLTKKKDEEDEENQEQRWWIRRRRRWGWKPKRGCGTFKRGSGRHENQKRIPNPHWKSGQFGKQDPTDFAQNLPDLLGLFLNWWTSKEGAVPFIISLFFYYIKI